MSFSEPAFSFSIPSIHDNTVLGCRIFHPDCFSFEKESDTRPWRAKGAVLAHPYAPLGGSQDDPVVWAIGREILRKGFVLGTFNFRGAGSSKGRTSWTAKPELADYVSFVGFFVNYLHTLRPSMPSLTSQGGRSVSESTLSPIPSAVLPPPSRSLADQNSILLILGGYSYGSMVTSWLPSPHVIVLRFATAKEGSTESDIVSRAHNLAQQWNSEEQQRVRSTRGRQSARPGLGSPSHSLVVVGGDEGDPGSRRVSRDSRRSMDSIRKSFDFARKSHSHKRGGSGDSTSENSQDGKQGAVDLLTTATSYLLVSPLLPPASMFATFFSDLGSSRKELGSKHGTEPNNLVTNPCMAIYGSKDMFTSNKKLRRWAEELSSEAQSRFQAREVEGAGHFWHEPGVERELCDHVKDFAENILLS